MMRQQGFTNARNLTGGVLAWVDEEEVLTTRNPSSLIPNP